MKEGSVFFYVCRGEFDFFSSTLFGFGGDTATVY